MRALIVASALLASAASSAQQSGQAAWVYDLEYRESSAVVMTKLTTLTNVLGKGFTLDLSAFVGSNLDRKGRIIGGFVVGKTWNLADQATGFVGIGANVQEGRELSPVVSFGIGWRF